MSGRFDRAELTTLAVLVILIGACAAQFPFILSTRVLGNLLTDNAVLGMLAIGMTVVIITGGIDLSVGSVLAFVAVLLAVLITQLHVDPWLAFGLAMAFGIAFGALQGFAIHALGAPPFIVTLAGMFVARGAASLMTQESVPVVHPLYDILGQAGIPLPGAGRLTLSAIFMLISFAAAAVLLRRTRFGANIYALGGSARAAELMGVPTRRTIVAAYALSGFTASVAGILYSLYTRSGYPLAGIGVELDAIAAAVIGGTLLSGGYGRVLGTLWGVMILGLIQLYITLQGSWSSWVAKIAIGGLLLAFIVAQRTMAAGFRARGSAK
jgi:ribose/xylose/arabinose/galactoside ABC-type transport system permease subunit